MPNIGHVIGPTILLFFAALVAIIAIVITYNYFHNRMQLKVVQEILAGNKDLTPEQIHALFQSNSRIDLRKGFIGLALALACIICGIVMGVSGYKLAQTSFIGMSMFPGLIGITYLYFYFKKK